MATIQEINSSIIQGGFTNDQLNSIICAVRFARSQIAGVNKRTFVKGTKVKFTNNRTGQSLVGDVVEVKRTYIHVRTGTTTYRVPANMLEAA